ncbi:MAG: AMP-binding protein [Alphaproteobacteria bacterium]
MTNPNALQPESTGSTEQYGALWRPTEERIKKTNAYALMQEKGLTRWDELYEYSILQGRQFWVDVVKRLGVPFKNGYAPTPDNIVDLSNVEYPLWMPGAQLNIVDLCFIAPQESTALIYRREGADHSEHFTYEDLDRLSNRVASSLAAMGYKSGDRIAIDMPMNVEAVAAYLGILKLGGVVVCLADSFKEPDIEIRMDVANPVKAIFTQDFTGIIKRYPLYACVVNAKNMPAAIVVTDSEEPRASIRGQDIYWPDFMKMGSDYFTSATKQADDAICILFSSSTSNPKEKDGEKPKPPKAIPWKAHTAIKSAMDAHFHHDMQPGKVLCWPTNLGWMMGSFAIFAALGNKGTLAIFDASPLTTEFAKFVESSKVDVLGLVPGISESWQKTGYLKGANWNCVDCFSSTGSPSNAQNYHFLMSQVEGFAPVIEYMGGTEIGGGYLSSSVLHPASPSCFTTATLGTDIFVAPEANEDMGKGEVFIVMRNGPGECPPMGLSTELMNFNHHDKYFSRGLRSSEGYLLREHGDVIVTREDGFIMSNGRADDGINLNGIKTSSLDIENYIKSAQIEGLKEVAAIAVRPPKGGEDWLVIFATAQPEITSMSLRKHMRDAIKRYNPQLAKIHDVVLIEKMPLTATGKLRRRWLQDTYFEQHCN